MIKVKKDFLNTYNDKETCLIFYFVEGQSSTLYEISGWFGKTLSHLLKSKNDLQYKQRWSEYVSSTPTEIQQDFLRLISTLTEEGIFEQLEESSLQPLLETEWTNFGKGDFKGSMTKEKIEDEELIAYAHEICESGSKYPNTLYGDGCSMTFADSGHDHCVALSSSLGSC